MRRRSSSVSSSAAILSSMNMRFCATEILLFTFRHPTNG
jgi:hypothetical protein